MKYEFTGETKVFDEVTFNRIRRLSDGLVGGWLEKESNLSHEGECFVYELQWGRALTGTAPIYSIHHKSNKGIPKLKQLLIYILTLIFESDNVTEKKDW